MPLSRQPYGKPRNISGLNSPRALGKPPPGRSLPKNRQRGVPGQPNPIPGGASPAASPGVFRAGGPKQPKNKLAGRKLGQKSPQSFSAGGFKQPKPKQSLKGKRNPQKFPSAQKGKIQKMEKGLSGSQPTGRYNQSALMALLGGMKGARPQVPQGPTGQNPGLRAGAGGMGGKAGMLR